MSCGPRTPVRFLSWPSLTRTRAAFSRLRVRRGACRSQPSTATERLAKIRRRCGTRNASTASFCPERAESGRRGDPHGRARIIERGDQWSERGAAVRLSERERRSHAEAKVGARNHIAGERRQVVSGRNRHRRERHGESCDERRGEASNLPERSSWLAPVHAYSSTPFSSWTELRAQGSSEPLLQIGGSCAQLLRPVAATH